MSTKLTRHVLAATKQHLSLRDRVTHPACKTDKQGRQYLRAYYPCCVGIRPPSAAWPYTESQHGRTVEHTVNAYNDGRPKREHVTVEAVRKAARLAADYGVETLEWLVKQRTYTVESFRAAVKREGIQSRHEMVRLAAVSRLGGDDLAAWIAHANKNGTEPERRLARQILSDSLAAS